MLLGDDGWFIMKVLLLLVLLTVLGCESIRVVGQTGQNVTLNCRYDIIKIGATYACWNKGDVSLMILNLTEEDSGVYGCRVVIPGWFSDQKHHFVLCVEKAPDLTTSPQSDTKMLTERQDVAKTTADLMTTDNLLTYHSTNSIRAKDVGSMLSESQACVLFFVVALVTAAGFFIYGPEPFPVIESTMTTAVYQHVLESNVKPFGHQMKTATEIFFLAKQQD
ncbi:hepatitis A virus cellular receptor 1 homolog [Cyprinodon tularosa]|uniref:hepatitis A virus cellular receptor 1 homolog n=1 Tax=Cyprinodon tularosa TaxID=77115 RepID=UPI0018E23C7E|nr:hepatitis A virus cellular receptor 1 homolog [Cyprinodon tularosa]